jgi:membrane protein YqaA with SNARE-associated domain
MVMVLAALTYGVGSAFVPLLNAEVYVAASSHDRPSVAILVVGAVALGQTAGKVTLFEAARHGSERFARKRATPRWATRLGAALSRRRTGAPLVLTSATLGLPPLAAVSLAAGASGQRRWEFALLCLFGRTARFGVVALSLAWAMR